MTITKDIETLKKRGFYVRKVADKKCYIVTHPRDRTPVQRIFKYSEIKNFVKEMKDNEKSYWRLK